MADAPTGGGIGAKLKKVPTPVWLAAGGAVLGLGYRALKDRKAADSVDTGNADVAPQDALYAGDQLSYTPSPVGGVVTAPSGDGTGAAETVGAVGQTALETSLSSLTSVINALLTREYGPNYQQPSVPTVAVPQTPSPAAAPPPPQPRPKPAAPVRPAGYQADSGINTGTGRKVFPGASGVKELARDEKKGIVAFGVAYPNHVLQRWHYDFKGAHRGAWHKVWEGRW